MPSTLRVIGPPHASLDVRDIVRSLGSTDDHLGAENVEPGGFFYVLTRPSVGVLSVGHFCWAAVSSNDLSVRDFGSWGSCQSAVL